MAERISTPSKTKEIIEANRFGFKKNFGQNFLIDSNILDNIAACAGVTKEDCVLEIGPGIGALTQVLAENAGHHRAPLRLTLRSYTEELLFYPNLPEHRPQERPRRNAHSLLLLTSVPCGELVLILLTIVC